jgi:methyl-accepting chemotaxis protein
MMKRLVGYTLILSAITGVVISVAGIFAIWRFKAPLTDVMNASFELLVTTLSSTQEGLNLADQALQTASTSVETLESTVATLAKTIDDTRPLIGSLTDLLGNELPSSVMAAQTSLNTAQSSAKIIDDVLRLLTAIPFFPGERYNPQVPLNIALGQVSASLDPLPASFDAMHSSLEKTDDNLVIMKADIELIAVNINQVHRSLDASRQVVLQYQGVTTNLLARVESIRGRLAFWIDLAAWILTFVLVWLASMQIGLFLQGKEALRRV